MKASNVLIYRDIILPPSETFIISQGKCLASFNAFYVGSRKVSGIDVPLAILINNGGWLGKLYEILFKVLDRVTWAQLAKLRSLNPSLIHAHFGPDGVLANTLAKALHIPLIVTFHGYDATTSTESAKTSFFSHRKYIRQRHELMRDGSRFIAVSEFIKRKVVEQGFPAEKILVHYIGIDTTVFQPSSEVTREPIVLFVGRLVEKKGCEYLIRAMHDVQASFPKVELVIIGDGPLRGQLEVDAEKYLKRYRFLGAQPPHAVREWMNRAKIFSVPSITAESGDAEGFGMVFAEAQAMGLPVVSFSSGGIPEAVAHGETGLLAVERDFEGLADNIICLLTDEELWSLMSRQGQKRVRAQFDLVRQTLLLEGIYQDVLAGQKKKGLLASQIQSNF